MYVGKDNVGYTIVDEIAVGNLTFVLGYNPVVKLTPWVTWMASERSGYNWGHYFMHENDARLDLYTRAYKEACYLFGSEDEEEEPA